MTQQHLELGDCTPADTADWRVCIMCGVLKPLSAYWQDSYQGDNLAKKCSRCQEVFKQMRQQYRTQLVARFYKAQNGLCPVCDQLLNLDAQPHLDHPHSKEAMHDHHTLAAAMTGLLHRNCNTALGMLNDDPAALRRAAQYLERTRCYGQLTLDL